VTRNVKDKPGKAETRKRSRRPKRAALGEIRREFKIVLRKLKSLECTDSMILVEFWHALDAVNGEGRKTR
jgi:hypothetical protein